jgi:tRNA nucleotidyltransferase/poly(A) polymerase
MKRIKRSDFPVPKDIKKISQAFKDAGKDLYIVGGCVRDFLQGKEPKDIDLVTNSQPDQSISILRGSGFRVSDEQGKKFGVLRVYTKDEPLGYELATYRKDISKGRDTKGDDAKVEIGEHITIEDDVRRRDLTSNSLFYDLHTGEIVDLVGGIDDIENNIVRAVGVPSQRFDEDRLRILRVLRFSARSGSTIDKATEEAILKDNRLIGVGPIDDISPERVWEEFVKAHGQCKDFKKYLDLITYFDMWDQVFPGSFINQDFVDSDDLIIILAGLFITDDRPQLERILIDQYKIEGDVAKKVIFLIKSVTFDGTGVLQFFRSKGSKFILDSELKEWWDIMGCKDPWNIHFFEYKPSILAEDLMKVGLKGKMLGDKLNELEDNKFKELWERN